MQTDPEECTGAHFSHKQPPQAAVIGEALNCLQPCAPLFRSRQKLHFPMTKGQVRELRVLLCLTMTHLSPEDPGNSQRM